MIQQSMISLLVAAAFAASAMAAEKPVDLKKGPGIDKVEGNCAACHSLDYVQMNSPAPNAAFWDAEVTKMIRVFGAPIDDADAKAITEYLNKNYGG
jgi:mono/diheme cytochrome c family protein